MTFPTGKPHVSFSEVKVWKECSYRHKLAYVDKLDTYEANPYADYGTAVHNAIENAFEPFDFSVRCPHRNLPSRWLSCLQNAPWLDCARCRLCGDINRREA